MLLHSALFPASVSFAPTSFIFFLNTSRNLLFDLPLFLFPGNFISITLFPTHSWSLLMTCSYRLILPSLIFIPNRSALTVPLIYSFLILSFLVTLIAKLNILISTTSISSTCFFVNTTVSNPYIAGLTTELYIFLLLQLVAFFYRLLLILFSISSILPAHSSLPPSRNYHFLAPLIPNT